MISTGLTILWIDGRMAVAPELDHQRATFVLGKIDEILTWERTKEQERDVRFVELGEYLCEVRAKQYWRLEGLNSFDEFLAKRFPESRRKAYYLMAIHENLTRIPKQQLRAVGWSKAVELVKVARRDGEEFDRATWLHKASEMPIEDFKVEVERHLTGKETEPWEIDNVRYFSHI
jgi:transcriptional regulator of met regulon